MEKRNGRNRKLSSETLKTKADERKRSPSAGPGEEIQKGITCGTAVGAKQGRTKGNIQKAKYIEPEEKARETRPGTRGKTWKA